MTNNSTTQVAEGHPFRNASVAFAVDVSGSTAGEVLHAEKSFVLRVSSLLAPTGQIEAAIIPWDTKAKRVRKLAKLDTLSADAFTQPAGIIEDDSSRLVLKRSSIWFLLTDGMISDDDRERFALKFAEEGFHGLTCVTVIFGETTRTQPSKCNISVGISVYAASPNCLFLYHDVHNGSVYIFAAKGIFKSLLGSSECPVIDDNIRWSDIPRLDLSQLSSIRLPPAKKLSKDELALQGDVVVNLEDLFSNKLSESEVENILSNEDSLSTIIQTAQSRNQTSKFRTWVQQQQVRVEDPVDRRRPDLGQEAESTFRELIGSYNSSGVLNPYLKQQLRAAYAANMAYFHRKQESNVRRAHDRSKIIQWSTRQSMTPSASPMSLSLPSMSVQSSRSMQSAPPAVHRPSSTYRQRQSTPQQPVSAPQAPSRATNPDVLYTKGFRKRQGSFTGRCSICDGNSETMAWLFHPSVSHAKTPGFPALMESSTPAFPLAAGNFPETDILCAQVCCEACSYFFVKTKSSVSDEAVVGALPIVPFIENELAYKKILYKVLGGRFDPQYVPQVFLSILLNIPGIDETPTNAADQLYRQAVMWTCKDIIYNSTSLPELSLAFSLSQHPSQLQELNEVLKAAFQNINELTSCLMLYPLDGFIVALRAAVIAEVNVEARRRAVFRRYLYMLAEAFKQKGISHQAMKAYLSSEGTAGESTPHANGDAFLQALPGTPKVVLTLPISDMRGSLLLNEHMYRKLATLEEFNFLAQADTKWVGPATATFVHAMVMVDKVTNMANNAWDLFNATMNHHRLGAISVGPEDFSLQEAAEIIQHFV